MLVQEQTLECVPLPPSAAVYHAFYINHTQDSRHPTPTSFLCRSSSRVPFPQALPSCLSRLFLLSSISNTARPHQIICCSIPSQRNSRAQFLMSPVIAKSPSLPAIPSNQLRRRATMGCFGRCTLWRRNCHNRRGSQSSLPRPSRPLTLRTQYCGPQHPRQGPQCWGGSPMLRQVNKRSAACP